MNETRLKIIELISDYMDKTLNNGCLVLYNMIDTAEWKEYKGLIKEYDWQNYDKILWHYDITAVFDYINGINVNWVWPVYFDNIIWQKDFWVFQKTDYSWHIKIPKKPLHLYTEQEEKELLELLLKLKNEK